MGCEACGFDNEQGARFCGECGQPLAVACSGCGSQVRAGLKFCDQCGTPVGSAPGETPGADQAATLVAQRKTITVVFGDVGGSTGLGERLDPEAAREVMNQYHRDVLELIGEHGGTVDKFNGDGFMATFGIPEVAEDDAERAVAAAVKIQERFEPFAAGVHQRHGGDPITLRIGVNTGEIVIAEGDPDIIGDALNVAARLERACPSGAVLVGPETWRLTRQAWAFEPQGEVTVAGRVEPVDVFLVDAATTQTETSTPFVGRDGELGLLRSVLDEAVDARTFRLVSVIGSPGLGKTRLASEAVAALDATHAFTVVCDRVGSSTYAPVAELVRVVAGISDGANHDDVRAALDGRLAAVNDRTAILDALVGIVGAGPMRSTEEAFWAVRRLVETLGREGETVLVFDDIQWAEPVVLDLLEHLAEWVADAPVLVVCLARPEIRDLRPALCEPGRRADHVVALEGLDASATAQLASRMLGSELPSALIDRLPSSTEGNPLFVRELVKMLVDDEVIRRVGEGWELTIDAEAVEVPPTIQSLLAARIDRLADDERLVLERASVIGSEFAEGALRSMIDNSQLAAGLPAVLERLRRMELVQPTGSYWGDEPLLRFHHVLVRDAAYRRLLKGTRADLHEQVASWTEAASVGLLGEHDEAVAFHEERAHHYRRELGPLDDAAIETGRSAARRLEAAARRTLDQDDLAASGALATRALACIDAEDPLRPELLLLACEARLGAGDVDEGEALVDELDALATDDRLRAWAACFRAQLTSMTDPDRLVEAEQEATAAAGILAALRDDAGAAKGHLTRARILALLGRIGEADAELDRALTAARDAGDNRRITAVLGLAPLAAVWGPSPVARAGGRCLDIVRLLRITTRAPAVEATSMRSQALLEAFRSRFDTARSMIDRVRHKTDELGLPLGVLEAELAAGVIEFLAGDGEAADVALRKAYNGLVAMRLGAEAGQAAALLGRVLLDRGALDEAEILIGSAERMAGRNLKTSAAWRIARADLLLARGEVAEAVEVARSAVGVVAETDLVVDQIEAELVLSRALRAAGDDASAAEAELRAERLATEKDATALIGVAPAADVEEVEVAAGRDPRVPTDEPSRSARSAAARAGDIRPGPSALQPWDPEATTVAKGHRAWERAVNSGDYSSRSMRSPVDPDQPLYDEELLAVDHRPLFAASFGAEELIRSLDPLHRVELRPILVTVDRVGLWHLVMHTQEFVTEVLGLVVFSSGGSVVENHTFDLDQLDEAVDVHHRLVAEDAERNGEELIVNDAGRLGMRGQTHCGMRAFDRFDELLAPDFEHDDRRSGFGGLHLVGRKEFRRNNELIFDGKFSMFGPLIRTVEDRLALQQVWLGTTDYYTDFLYLFETTEDGLGQAGLLFDLDRYDDAVAELERRAAALGVEPWDPEATTVVRTFRERSKRVRPILVTTDRVGLFHGDRENGDLEILELVRVTPDGAVPLHRTFDVDQIDEAVDVYHQLVVEDAELHGEEVIANAASRYLDWANTHLAMRSIDRVDERTVDDFELMDHRQVAGGLNHLFGRDEWRQMSETLWDGEATVFGPVLRIAGDRVALHELRMQIGGRDFHVDMLHIGVLDERGSSCASALYDLDQYDEAIAELGRRAAALAGSSSSPVESWEPMATTVWRNLSGVARSINAGEGIAEWTAPEYVWVDHRAVLQSTNDLAITAEVTRTIDHADVELILNNVDRVALARFVLLNQGFEIEQFVAWAVTPDGLVHRNDTYAIDDLDAALDRYHELVVEDAERHGGEVLTNAATRIAARAAAHGNVRGFDEIDSLLAPESELHDLRRLIDHHAMGPEAVANVWAESFPRAAKPSVQSRAIRIAGDRLALMVVDVRAREFRTDYLSLYECDGTGLMAELTLYDLDAFDVAVAHLQRRATELEGPTSRASMTTVEPWDAEAMTVMRVLRRSEAIVAKEGAGSAEILSLLTDDLVFVDNRPMFAGRYSRDQFFDSFSLTEGLSITPLLCATDRVGVDLHRFTAGGSEIEVVNVCAMTPDGLMWITENFEPDQLDEAVDRYFEVLHADAERFGGEVVDTVATRGAASALARMNLLGGEAAADAVAEGAEYHDHRALMDLHVIGRDEIRRVWSQTLPTGEVVTTARCVQTFGEHLCLEVHRVSARDYVVDSLVAGEFDDDGTATTFDVYDLDAFDDAVAHLERRVAEIAARTAATSGGPADPPAHEEWRTVVRLARRIAELVGASDRAGLRALTTDGLPFADHRPMFAGTFSADDWVASLAPIEEMSFRVLRCDTDRAALTHHTCFTQGFTVECLNVSRVSTDGRMVSLDTFDVDDVDVATARYDEIVADSTTTVERAAAQYCERIDAGDADGQRALFRESMRYEDHRPIFAGVFGREECASSTSGVRVRVFRHVAVGCDLVELVVWDFDTGDGFRIELIGLLTAHPEGGFDAIEVFDAEMVDEAVDHFRNAVETAVERHGVAPFDTGDEDVLKSRLRAAATR